MVKKNFFQDFLNKDKLFFLVAKKKRKKSDVLLLAFDDLFFLHIVYRLSRNVEIMFILILREFLS